ncbi:hypothetical protein BJ944DRAFT_244695 [Cunninghamella echinulata]|nr:hypothetical protein BJ944DRAFT_244695 [Cunninghamella echinulata]
MYVQQPQMYTSTTSSTSHVLPTDSTLYQQNLINVLSSPAPVSIPAPLDSDQLSDLVSTMIYIMWNLRRSSVMAIHTASMQGGNRDIIYSHPIQQGETALIVNGVDKAFKRFCHQILVVTQLSESVVILSLKYIAILLQNNPRIQGADGSEYRLFIVALLLANKFHDDNTYTNKTWSDISRMEISELNIMEFEFLDVLRYRLFVQKEEYDQWKMGLLSFMTQLKNVALLQEEKLMQSTIRNISMALQQQQQQQFIPLSSSSSSSITSPCSSLLTTTATATNDSHNHSLTPEQHYLYLLSKTQQPILPQPPHSPLTRVPLRIPIHPVYTITPIPSTHTTPMMIYSQPPFITPSTSTTSVNNNSNNNNNNLIPLTSASFNSNPMDFSTSSSYPLPLTSQPSSIVTTFPTTAIISPSSHVKPDHQHHYNHHYHHRFQPYQRSHHSSPMDSPSNNALKKDHQKKSRLRAQSNPTSFVSQPYDTTYFKQLYP